MEYNSCGKRLWPKSMMVVYDYFKEGVFIASTRDNGLCFDDRRKIK